MRLTKKILALAMTGIMTLGLAACGGGSSSSSAAPAKSEAAASSAAESTAASSASTAAASSAAAETTGSGDKIVIGASYNSLMNDVFTVTQTLMELWAEQPLEADDPQVDLTIVVADGDTTKQISDVNDLINKGCDVICIDPVDSTAVEPAIQACKDKGIPVITFNRPVAESVKTRPDVEVDIAAYDQGYDTAKTTFEKMKNDGIEEINVVLCNGETRDDNSIRRAKGVQAAAEEYGANVVAELPCDWDPTKVTELLPPALKGNENVNCVYVATDGMLSGVQSCLEDIGKWAPYGDENHMYVACCDVFEEGYNYVADGYVDSDSLMDVYGMIKGVFQSAFAMNNGETVEPLMEIKGAVYTSDNYDSEEMTSDELLWWKWKDK
ncbi:MAG: sugar ABC transporter substrate-binding protein [Eubacterium sp.]|nr:sugar ABC transporter substrate-binding protein [Eubacterium sp.]